MSGTPTHSRNDGRVYLTAGAISILAFLLYFATLAPGLTWAHFGADGGELVAAAVVNGVPHPPGYPLYMLLLKGWLALGRTVIPNADLAWLGNLFSALCAALSVGVTTLVGGYVYTSTSSGTPSDPSSRTTTSHDAGVGHGQTSGTTQSPHVTQQAVQSQASQAWIWAAVIGIAWATAPLLWRQAIITEVYALHALLISLLGWALIVRRGHIFWVTIPIGLGLAHHLTFVLLLPGVLYWLWHIEQTGVEDLGEEARGSSWLTNLFRAGIKLIPAAALGALFYIRIPLAASGGPPINWGYPDNWEGFLWLTSAEAYRSYLFGVPASSVFDRIAAWAYNLTSQFREPGLGLALLGLARWDRERPELRNLGLLWLLPISIYAISYYTSDSTIYLLPCMWLLALWLGMGVSYGLELLQEATPHEVTPPSKPASKKAGAKLESQPESPTLVANILTTGGRWVSRMPDWMVPAIAVFCLLLLAGYRYADISLRHDSEARTFVDNVESILPLDSIIISSADRETFSLWYGVWGSGQLLDGQRSANKLTANSSDSDNQVDDQQANDQQGPYLVNASLLQFPWYQRLVRERYSHLPGIGNPIHALIQENQDLRPIFFSEEDQGYVSKDRLEPVGPIWRYLPPNE